MKKLKIIGFTLITATLSVVQAQDLSQINKAIDAEQYEKAKSLLKEAHQSKPSNGKVTFLLGNIYLKQNIEDSAKIYFQKGLETSDFSRLNHIGFGQIDLDKGNVTAARAKFDLATKGMRKRDFEEYIYIARAYMNSENPDYKAAINILNKAKEINSLDAQVLLALGDAHYGNRNQNEAYSSYRAAFLADNTLLRAKMQLGVLLKGAKAFGEAEKAFDEVKSINPNYGPLYRELAETYYLWALSEPKLYNDKIGKALEFYKKYMNLTDYSLSSRMRHADFLILAKDYKALEVEANKMKEIDNVNPRILRYLGYSAYENGNIDVALESLTNYIGNPSNKIIARDYLYLGLIKLKKGISESGEVVNQAMLAEGVSDIKTSVEKEPAMASELHSIGTKLYEQRQYTLAASIFEAAVSEPSSKNFLLDNFYLGNAIYFDNRDKEEKDMVALQKADAAYANVIKDSPTTHDAYLFRARISSLMENDQMMTQYYEDFMRVVNEKGGQEVEKNKSKFIESYNNIAAHYANFDIPKAKEYFNKTLALDPQNNYALESLKILK